MELLNNLKTNVVNSNIREFREFKNYSQDYLALKLGVSYNTYRRIERGRSNIRLSRLLNIAEILEIDIIDLIKGGFGKPVSLKLVK